MKMPEKDGDPVRVTVGAEMEQRDMLTDPIGSIKLPHQLLSKLTTMTMANQEKMQKNETAIAHYLKNIMNGYILCF